MSNTSARPASLKEKIADFLAQPRIAVAGVSATRPLPGTLIYRKLKGAGHQVVAILPGATTFEGDPCYPDLTSIPGGLGGVVIATRPALRPSSWCDRRPLPASRASGCTSRWPARAPASRPRRSLSARSTASC